MLSGEPGTSRRSHRNLKTTALCVLSKQTIRGQSQSRDPKRRSLYRTKTPQVTRMRPTKHSAARRRRRNNGNKKTKQHLLPPPLSVVSKRRRGSKKMLTTTIRYGGSIPGPSRYTHTLPSNIYALPTNRSFQTAKKRSIGGRTLSSTSRWTAVDATSHLGQSRAL